MQRSPPDYEPLRQENPEVAPEQQRMVGTSDVATRVKNCDCTFAEVCDAIVSGTLTVLMACIIIPLGIPAFLVVFTLAGMGQVYVACGGSEKDWRLFVTGADKPDEISEECNRDVDGRTEALRGQGACPNYAHHVRNNHPVFGIFCCDRGHPFSPVERFGLLVLLVSFGYFMAGLKMSFGGYLHKNHYHWNDMNLTWILLDCYSVVCITLPSMALQTTLKYFALLDYKYILNKYDYFTKQRRERCKAFLTQFCLDRDLGQPKPSAKKPKGAGGLWSLLDCDCCKKCCESMAVFKACQDGCEDGHNQAVNGIFAGLFAGLAFAGSCAFVIFGVRMDMDASEDVWSTFILGISLNFFLLWFLQSFLIFHVRWLYQHWEGRRWKVLNQTIPPVPECWLELEHCFRAMDADGDGFVSKEDASRLVRLHLSQDLKEESWDKLLAELDRDQDAKLSLEEVEAIRIEFATKTGWWFIDHSMPQVQGSQVPQASQPAEA